MLGAALMAAALTCAPPPSTHEHTIVDAQVLLRLRDLSGLSLSPDGRSVAYQLQQADLASNTYHSVWCVAPTEGHGAPQFIGDGGDIMMPILAGLERPTGMWNTLSARWSPDGSAIAFLARRQNQTQIEICTITSSHCRRASSSDGDVEDFIWSDDGLGLIYQARPSREAARLALEGEGDVGFHLDGRFDVYHSFAPLRSRERSEHPLRFIDLSSGLERPAGNAERDAFAIGRRETLSTTIGAARSVSLFSNAPVTAPAFLHDRDVRDFVRLGSGAVWTEPADPALAGAEPPLALVAQHAADAVPIRCRAAACVGRIVEMTVTPDGESVLFIKREGWGDSRHGLYLWDIGANRVRQVWSGDEVVRVCTARAHDAICLFEGPTSPRRIIALDYATGAMRSVVDPNSELPRTAFTSARKLQWRSPGGDELFGYVLLPPGHRHLPLIVVQYRATGFLRGGVGDEYPVQAFTHRGFAVLVIERPDPRALLASISDGREIDRREWDGLAERWRTLAALTSGIDQVVHLGIADAKRVGVTGLSDGAETAVFALIHCSCIAAAAISSGVHDPLSYYFSSDSERADMRASGRGDDGSDRALWPALSLSLNVEHIHTPILTQVPDRELVFSLEAQRTFADHNRPFDLYVFPNEYHVKWQPRHRAAIYERSLDWFSFWLLGEEDHDPDKAEQYDRWRAWRSAALVRP
ncbi:MAG: Atxe2 family lasso peptide isopeptidase [Proteobacteria bacterium]|nr:Atxe2 family lasso peptide isopeptidase [Pseudomonadota bacterium]